MRNIDQLASAAQRAHVPGPELTTRVATGVMLGGAIALGSGTAPARGAQALIVALSGVTLTVHPFWRETDAAARTAHRESFITNLALLGGLISAVAAARKMPAR